MVYQRKWHVVIYGTEPGVYSSWIEAGPKTKNIPGGAIYQSFPSKDEAFRVFEAARARGEVRAYSGSDVDQEDNASGESKNVPLSPLGEEAALLRTPLDLTEDTDRESIALQMSFSSPARSRVKKLKRALRDPTDSYSTFSSPPTKVTQVYAPLYEDDDVLCGTPIARPSPHFTFTSSSSGAYPLASDENLLESSTGGMPFRFEVSDLDLPPLTPSSLNTHPGAEEHTSGTPRCMPLHPKPPPKSKGVVYRSLADFANTKRVDSRIWLPESRVFDPDKVKPRPLTRPSSPAKKDTSSVSCHKAVGDSPQLQSHNLLADSPLVRVGRGRDTRLTLSLSLPILPNRELADDSPGFGSQPAQLLGSHPGRADTAQEIDCSVWDNELAERPTGYCPSPRNYGRSHVQLVPREGKGEQSPIVVRCPPDCPHETCYRCPPLLSAPTVEPSRSASSRYVDACVSPIIAITSRIHGADRPVKIDHPCELVDFTHISHKGIAPEADVRSPIVKGTMIPVNAAEMGRIRWRNASRVRRVASLTRLFPLFDLACFSVALTVTVLTHAFWVL